MALSLKKLCLLLALTLLSVFSIHAQAEDEFRPGAQVIFTAESTPVYAYPDENSAVVAMFPQGYVDRLGPGSSRVGDWVFIMDQVGYVRIDEAGLRLNTDDISQQLVAELTAEIDQATGNSDLFIRRGTIYAYIRDYPSALADYTSAIEINPQESRTYTLRSKMYRFLHRYDDELADVQQAIALGADDAWTLIALGGTYARLDQYQMAIDALQVAYDQYPDAYWAPFNLGVMQQILREYEEALDYFDQATEINVYGERAYINRSFIYRYQDNNAAAINELNEYLEINPFSSQTYTQLGILYDGDYLNQPYTAMEYLDKALEFDPQNSEAYRVLAGLYAYSIGDVAKALEEYQKAHEFDPFNLDILDEVGTYYARIGDFETGLQYFDELAALGESSARYYTFRAQMYLGLGNYDAGRAALWEYMNGDDIPVFENIAAVHLTFAMIDLQDGDYLGAADNYNVAFLLTPAWTRRWSDWRGRRVIDSRAVLAGQYAQGITNDPMEPDNYLQLANILMEFGAWDDALDYYRQYLTMVDNPDLQYMIDLVQEHLDETE